MIDSVLKATLRLYGEELADRDFTAIEVAGAIADLHERVHITPPLSAEHDDVVRAAWRARRRGTKLFRRDRAVGQAIGLFDDLVRLAKKGQLIDDASMSALREKLNDVAALSKQPNGKEHPQ